MALEQHCTLLVHLRDVKTAATQIDEVTADLERGDDEAKCRALKTTILLLLNGEDMSELLMTVIRYCVNTKHHKLKKLLELYWEAVPKYNSNGELRPEMILVCNALRNDLIHPNEYIAGCTLRFLCKLQEPELLEPLIPSIKQLLEHRDAYTRANAVLCIYNIFKVFPRLLPDAPELIDTFLENEDDSQAQRNAFTSLFEVDQERAVDYLVEHIEQVEKFSDGMQLAVLAVARRVCRADPSQKSRFVRCIFELLQSPNPAVAYESASTLVALSASPTAVRAAASCFCKLLVEHSDNNVKLIVLEMLGALRKRHLRVMEELVIDVLRALSTPSFAIRRRTLEITTTLLSKRNISAVMHVLRKELTESKNEGNSSEYQTLLVKSIHQCAKAFPSVAGSVVHLLMDFITGTNDDTQALPVVQFIREILQTYDSLREGIISKLLDLLPTVSNPQVAEVVLWIIGEYCEDVSGISNAFDVLQECLGPIPFIPKEDKKEEDEPSDEEGEDRSSEQTANKNKAPKINSDGTYASQTAISLSNSNNDEISLEDDNTPNLRKLLLKGEPLVISAIASMATKMSLRVLKELGEEAKPAKMMAVKVMLIICAILDLGRSTHVNQKMEQGTVERLRGCLCMLLHPGCRDELAAVFLEECRSRFEILLDQKQKMLEEEKSAREPAKEVVQPDRVITFRHLRSKAENLAGVELDDDLDLSLAVGSSSYTNIGLAGHLKRVHQLTGFSDPVYVEAFMTVHDYDIVIQFTVINRTDYVLNDFSIELATMGDLRIVERPQNFTVPARGVQKISGSIKVSSTETGHVFGNVVYCAGSSNEKTTTNLNDIHVDIMDYIRPAFCTEDKFRDMWAEFEWENKVAVNTEIQDVAVFLKHIQKIANMSCLTPGAVLSGSCNFLAANLYASSVFGEDALLNVSVEKRDISTTHGMTPDTKNNESTPGACKLVGYMRIRSKTQGIALSLGDRVQLMQRNLLPED